MKHNVYICYAKEDRAAADTVCGVLENAGIKCWYAPRNLVSEGDRDAKILDAIRVSRIMVLIFSESANNSQQVLAEVSTAVQMGCLLIPIRISAASPTGALQYHLAAVQILNAQDGTLEEAAGKLAGMLDQFRERWYPDTGPVPEPVPVRAKGAAEGFEIQDGVLSGYHG